MHKSFLEKFILENELIEEVENELASFGLQTIVHAQV
jgi:hypothetical protein